MSDISWVNSMESKVTTYLFYTGLIFSLIVMLFCTFIFHSNLESQTYSNLESCAEAVSQTDYNKAVLPKNIYLAIFDSDGKFITGDRYDSINSSYVLSPFDLEKLKENGNSHGKIKTKSVKSDIYYYLFGENEKYICIYTEMSTVYTTASHALPYLAAVFFGVLALSALSSIFLTDRFMKPIYYISSDSFDASKMTDDPKIYRELIPILKVKSKAEKMKRQFTANVSHELKTPLTSILGYAQLIESGIAEGEDVIKFASVINKESQRMLYLVGDILKLSELEEENANILKEPADLHEIAKLAIESLEVVAKKNSVTLSLNGEKTIINANKNLMYELIYNLCDNAIRYNKPNGSVSVVTKDNYVSVTDTGIGIDPKYHSRIFERFYRVDKSRSKQTGGTGLGLSIVKHIAELHEGEIFIKSKPGEGTSITVKF